MPAMKERLSTKAGYLILSNALNVIFGFVGTIVVVRFLTRADFGTYKQALLVFSMLAPIFTLGVPSSLLYFVPRFDEKEREQFISQTIFLLQLLGLLFCLTMLALSSLIAGYFNNSVLGQILVIYSVFALFTLPCSTFTYVLISLERFRLSALIAVIFALTSALAFIIPMVLGYPLVTVFIIMDIVVFLQFVYALVFMRGLAGGVYLTINWDTIKKQIDYAVPLGLAGIIGSLAWNTDRFMVSLFFSPATYAIYVIGAVEVPLVQVINAAVNNVLVPEFSILYEDDKRDRILEIWHEAIRKTSLIVLPTFVFLMLFSEPLVTFFYTTKYINSIPIFRIYLFMLPLRVTTYSLILQASGYTRDIMKGTSAYILVNIILNYILIKLIGLPGPAVATIISTILLSAYFLVKVKVLIKVSWVEIFPWKKTAFISIVSIVVGLILLPILLLSINTFIKLLIGGLLFIGLFFGMGVKTRVITKEDCRLIKEWLLLKPLRLHSN